LQEAAIASDASLDDRVAIVTGAGTGIGAATARLLHAQGLTVALVARRRDRLEAVAAGLDRAFVVPADLGEAGAPARVVDAVLERTGRLDVLVNNAAAFELPLVADATQEQFDRHVAVNLRAPYFLVQAALPALRVSPAPVVVNVSSAAAAMYRPRQTIYGLTKAGLEHLTKNLAAELARDRIRVNCVRPGPVATEIYLAVDDPEARLRQLASMVPLGRVGQPDEIARWVWHLVDRDAEWVTGIVLPVDGGRLLGPPDAI
jgi:NAD(P)-dependent dehydrogenase (short-subunit alcohol dehydrogenase family)